MVDERQNLQQIDTRIWVQIIFSWVLVLKLKKYFNIFLNKKYIKKKKKKRKFKDVNLDEQK